MRRAAISTCPGTGITVPECSCPECISEQIQRYQPALLAADPIGEIRVIRAAAVEAHRDRPRPTR